MACLSSSVPSILSAGTLTLPRLEDSCGHTTDFTLPVARNADSARQMKNKDKHTIMCIVRRSKSQVVYAADDYPRELLKVLFGNYPISHNRDKLQGTFERTTLC